MKCHAGVEFPDGKPCPKCGAKLGEVCWPGINADLLELPKAKAEIEKLRYQLASASDQLDDLPNLIRERDELRGAEREAFQKYVDANEALIESQNQLVSVRLDTIEECAKIAEQYPSSGAATEYPVEHWIRQLIKGGAT